MKITFVNSLGNSVTLHVLDLEVHGSDIICWISQRQYSLLRGLMYLARYAHTIPSIFAVSGDKLAPLTADYKFEGYVRQKGVWSCELHIEAGNLVDKDKAF